MYYREGVVTPKHGTFEWIVGWEELAAHVSPAALGLPAQGARAVDLGCGTSELPVHLASAGYASVTAIDRDAGCIAHMSSRHNAVPGLQWRQCDLMTGDVAALLPGGAVELVLDKGTLDCALAEDTVAQLLIAVHRMLASGGAYVAISFRPTALLRPLLTCEALGFEPPQLEPLAALRGEDSTLCRMRKRAAATRAPSKPLFEEVAAHVRRVCDWYYREEQPLLTPERRAALRAAWAMARCSLSDGGGGGEGTLPLSAAFELVLSAEEQEEVGLEAFADDVRGFLEDEGAAAITLPQALGYLEASQ